MAKFVIFGAGGHCNSVASAIIAHGDSVTGIIDPHSSLKELFGVPVYTTLKDTPISSESFFAIAIGDNANRAAVAAPVLREFPITRFKPIIHPTASIGHNASVGLGTVILANATVGANSKIGEFCVVNNNAVADHDTKLAAYTSIGPAASLGGRVEIGEYSAVGIGAVAIEGVRIGTEVVVIGANSTVLSHVPDHEVQVGSPATKIKSRRHGDSYLK